jgi:hydrogenase maturation protease
MNPRILIAGIGNIFLGDDAFGVEVAQRLMRLEWPENVQVNDFGIRGLDLCYALMDDYDAFILIDAVPRGGEPGMLYTIKISPDDLGDDDAQDASIDAHSLDPLRVLRSVRAMGARPKRVLLVGCESAALGEEEQLDGRMGLSSQVAAAVDEAVRMTQSLVDSLCNEIRREICAKETASTL